MSSRQKTARILKIATLLIGLVLLAIIVSVLKDIDLRGRLVPTEQRRTNRETPVMHFDADRAAEGFTAPADTHVIFTIPTNARVSRNIFFGPEYDAVRYWGYCFYGDEAARKKSGLRGLKIYHEERFFYSLAEKRAQGGKPKPTSDDLLGILQSLHGAAPREPDSFYNVFEAGDTCYVMSSASLPAGLDADGDLLNAALERMLGTHPLIADTDRDGITDGNEYYTTKTLPKEADTDRDGPSDLCEDKDQDGYLDAGETSALTWDTDRDDLCDGWGEGCRVGFTSTRVRVNGQWEWMRVPETPVWTELGDSAITSGCPDISSYFTDPTNPTTYGDEPDWDYQWRHFVGHGAGTPKPELPTPDLPGKDIETEP